MVRGDTALDPADLRLPIIALIDVILFLLMYFMFSGALEAEERQLAAGLAVERGGRGETRDLQPQIVDVQTLDGREVFRLGERVFTDRAALAAVLHDLPKEVGVVIHVADDVSVGAIATATQVCHDEGFDKISYVSASPQPRSGQQPRSGVK